MSSPRLLISYSRDDIDFVRRLHRALEQRDIGAWVDWEGIPPSAEWMAEIREAIDSVEAFIFVLSDTSLASEVCKEELAHAVTRHKRLIPVVRSDAETASVPASLAELNWIFAREADDFDAAVDAVVEALETNLAWVKEHTRLLRRAVEWETSDEDASKLLGGGDLDRAEETVAREAETDPRPTALQRRFLVASRRRATSQARTRLAAVTVGMVVAIALAITAWVQREHSERRAGAALALSLTETKPRLALERAVDESQRRFSGSVPEVRSALLAAVQMPKERSILELPGEIVPRSVVVGKSGVVAVAADLDHVAPAQCRDILRWDAGGRRLEPPLAGRLTADSAVVGIAGCAARDVIAVWTRDGKVSMRDLAGEGRELLSFRVSGSHESDAPSLNLYFDDGGRARATISMSTDGELVALGGSFGAEVWAWNPEPRKVLDSGYFRSVTAVAIGPSREEEQGRYVVFGSDNGAIEVFEIRTGDSLLDPPDDGDPDPWLGRCAGSVRALAFHPEEADVFVSADEGGSVRRWRVGEGQLGDAFQGHTNVVSSVTYAPDGRIVVSGSHDNSVRIWNASTGTAIGEALRGHTSWVKGVAVGPDGTIVSVANDGTLRQWEVTLRWTRLPFEIGEPLAISDDPPSAITTTPWRTLSRWRAESVEGGGIETVPEEIDHPHRGEITMAARSGDGRVLATLDGSGLLVTSYGDGTDPDSAMFPGAGALAVSASGDRIAVAVGPRIFVGRPPGGEPLEPTRDDAREIESLAFGPNGVLASGGRDNTLQLWNDGGPIGEPFRGHEGWVSAIAFSPDGRHVATGSWDRSVRLWTLEGHAMGRPRRGHEAWIRHLRFTADGDSIVSWDDDGNEGWWRAAGPDDWLDAARSQLALVSDSTKALFDLERGKPGPPPSFFERTD